MKLHEQVKVLREENKILRAGYHSLSAYLASDKFNWPYVNVQDIFLRMNETLAEANEVE